MSAIVASVEPFDHTTFSLRHWQTLEHPTTPKRFTACLTARRGLAWTALSSLSDMPSRGSQECNWASQAPHCARRVVRFGQSERKGRKGRSHEGTSRGMTGLNWRAKELGVAICLFGWFVDTWTPFNSFAELKSRCFSFFFRFGFQVTTSRELGFVGRIDIIGVDEVRS